MRSVEANIREQISKLLKDKAVSAFFDQRKGRLIVISEVFLDKAGAIRDLDLLELLSENIGLEFCSISGYRPEEWDYYHNDDEFEDTLPPRKSQGNHSGSGAKVAKEY